MNAQSIRDFFRQLFGSRYIAQLELDLIAMRQEREYFKGRAERLEMMLMQRVAPRIQAGESITSEHIPQNTRKTLAQLQKELTEREESEMKAHEKEN
jgi:hypothetical protein